jgi:formate/nitrite transporter FocA (FNT family)
MRLVARWFWEAGSLAAGFLIGLALVASVFAMTTAPGESQAIWMLSAPITLALGLALQVVVTLKPPQPLMTGLKA